MWSSLLASSKVALLSGSGRDLRGFFQTLTHFAVHTRAGSVLWCDGDHGFDPYEMAELNLTSGFAADDGADRVLIKRCMTPFQWDSVLTRHLPEKIGQTETALVIATPFDRLWSHEEIQDWEQEDYTRFSLASLQATAKRENVPILLGVDMERWWKTHPTLARITQEGVDVRWRIEWMQGRWRAVREDGEIVDPMLRRSVTLLDYLPEEEKVAEATAVVPTKRKMRGEFRTRIVHPMAR